MTFGAAGILELAPCRGRRRQTILTAPFAPLTPFILFLIFIRFYYLSKPLVMVVLAFLGAWLSVVPPDYVSGPCRARGTTDVGIKHLVYPIYSSGCFCSLSNTGPASV